MNRSGSTEAIAYLRDPAVVPFRRDCRSLRFLRFGLLITKVPLPCEIEEYSLSLSAMEILL